MPTVLRVRNVRVAIFSNDHPPPHAHAVGRGGAWARFILNCPDGPVMLMDQSGFRLPDIAEIGTAIASQLPTFCNEWSRLHG